MAKKRGYLNPIDNTAGSKEAVQLAAKENISTLTDQLSAELTKSGESVEVYLKKAFGISSHKKSIEWTLKSGKKATFCEVELSLEQVEMNTFVTFNVNGRDQDFLTKESLIDLESMKFQQFHPAVGREVNGKIDILDGSRRRAWFIANKDPNAFFKVLVTRDEITSLDAKALAKQLQSAKEHNLREIGLQCKDVLKANPALTQQQIGDMMGMSRQSVGRSLKAADISKELISVFPVVSDLTIPDYNFLHKIETYFNDGKYDRLEFMDYIHQEKKTIQSEGCKPAELKENLISSMKSFKREEKGKITKTNAVTTDIVKFNTTGVLAKKKENKRNRTFSYEFSRLPSSVQKELDSSIKSIVEKYKESMN